MPTKSTGAREKLSRHEITIRNKQRGTRLNGPAIQRFVLDFLLDETFQGQKFEAGIFFVDEKEITRLNETYLQHEGSTDIITFNYSEGRGIFSGELYISVPDAAGFAKEYGTSLESELARYCIHGVLHLAGYDDLTTQKRKVMKQVENRLLRKYSHRHDLVNFLK